MPDIGCLPPWHRPHGHTRAASGYYWPNLFRLYKKPETQPWAILCTTGIEYSAAQARHLHDIQLWEVIGPGYDRGGKPVDGEFDLGHTLVDERGCLNTALGITANPTEWPDTSLTFMYVVVYDRTTNALLTLIDPGMEYCTRDAKVVVDWIPPKAVHR